MELNWVKCEGDAWCPLNDVNLGHSHFDAMEGVYIVWHEGNHAATVRVGQGNIKDRLTSHRADNDIQAYNSNVLLVTWASVPENQRDGVESYLAQVLHPKVGDRFPDATPIPVNLP